MIGLEGLTISPEERELLRHPLIGGVILFGRNYHDPRQLAELNRTIQDLRRTRLLIAVDHEGGRVQRFRDGFTALPAARCFGHLYDRDSRQALEAARDCGWLLAAELRAAGIDLACAPVLDLDYGVSTVIGDRALHRDPQIVAELARALMRGMQSAGMAAVGKHFPGHGAIRPDSHHEIPVDERRYVDIATEDLLAFERMIHYGLPAIMPAHVIYPRVDSRPAGFSPVWLRRILRERLGFQGAILSDDLDMAGAAWAGEPVERARMALEAGCDLLLACNDRAAACAMLDGLQAPPDPAAQARRIRLHGRGTPGDLQALRDTPRWQAVRRQIDTLFAESRNEDTNERG